MAINGHSIALSRDPFEDLQLIMPISLWDSGLAQCSCKQFTVLRLFETRH